MSEGKARELLINRGMSPLDAELKMDDYMGCWSRADEDFARIRRKLQEDEEAGLIYTIDDIRSNGETLIYVWEN